MYREGHCGGGFYTLTAQLLSENGKVRWNFYSLKFSVFCTFMYIFKTSIFIYTHSQMTMDMFLLS